MGYKPVGRFFAVELPLAVPVIAAGVRVAVVSNVSLVAVATLIGTQQLGSLISDGLAASQGGGPWQSPLFIGIILAVAEDLDRQDAEIPATRTGAAALNRRRAGRMAAATMGPSP